MKSIKPNDLRYSPDCAYYLMEKSYRKEIPTYIIREINVGICYEIEDKVYVEMLSCIKEKINEIY